MTPATGQVCSRCGDILEGVPTETSLRPDGNICRTCNLAPPDFVGAVSWGTYERRLRDIIHSFKYDGLHPVGTRLALKLAHAISQFAADAPGEMLVVPVPLHRTKRRQRGFNQALTLAEAAVRALRKSHPAWRLTVCPNVVSRIKATATQAGLTPRQRRLNMRRAFAVTDNKAIAGRHILIIDDIFTTGATARALARELRRAGAASVRVATLARARMRNRVVSSLSGASEARPATTPADQPQSAGMHASTNQPSF